MGAATASVTAIKAGNISSRLSTEEPLVACEVFAGDPFAMILG